MGLSTCTRLSADGLCRGTTPKSSLVSSPTPASSIEEDPGNADPDVPFAPATVAKPPYPLFETPKVDLPTLRNDAFTTLRRMERVWGIDHGDELWQGRVTVLELLRVTVDAVRAVRAWSLAVPLAALAQREGYLESSSVVGKGRPSTISTPSRPAVVSRVVSGTASGGMGSRGNTERADPLGGLRRCALDVLVALRGLEERFRVEEKGDASVEEEEDLPEVSDNAGDTTTPGRFVEPDTEDPDAENLWLFSERFGDAAALGEGGGKTSWYERLTGGEEGWVYREDVVLEDVRKERDVVEEYLEAVEDTFGRQSTGRVWRLREGDPDEEGDVFGGKASGEGAPVTGLDTEAEGPLLPNWAVAERWRDMPDRKCSG